VGRIQQLGLARSHTCGSTPRWASGLAGVEPRGARPCGRASRRAGAEASSPTLARRQQPTAVGGPSGSLPRVRSSSLAPTPPPERRTTPLRSAHLRFPRRRSLRSSHPPPRWDAFFVSRRRRVSFPAALLSNQTARLALGASLLASSGRFRAIGWGCWCSLDGALGRRGRAPVS
jgi:hypothetical protein